MLLGALLIITVRLYPTWQKDVCRTQVILRFLELYSLAGSFKRSFLRQ